MTQDANKRQAAAAALSFIKDGMALGVGTGSTVDVFIELLAPLANKLGAVVSSSERSTRKLAAAGIRTVELNSAGDLDLYVDGADEATKHRHLIKGGGGALTREKIVAAASRRFLCIIDDTKLVATLGRFPLPVMSPIATLWYEAMLISAGFITGTRTATVPQAQRIPAPSAPKTRFFMGGFPEDSSNCDESIASTGLAVGSNS